MEKKKRIDWIDAAKGIGILLIVGVHSIRPDMREKQVVCKFTYDLILSFTIGMFFVLSGITYRVSGRGEIIAPKRFFLKKARGLLLPFLGYALVIYVFFSLATWCPLTAQIFKGTEYSGMVFTEYLRLTLCADSPYAAHLWFIWVLFWITMVVYTCDLLCKCWRLPCQKMLWLVTVVFCTINFICGSSNSIVQRVLMHMVYFVYGTELAVKPKILEYDSAYSKVAVMISAGLMICYVLFGWHAMTWYGEILWKVCWLLVRLIFIWGIFRLAMFLKGVKWLIYFGRESLWIYLLHQPFCCGFVGLLLYSKMGLPILLVCTICIFLGLLLPLYAIWLGRWVLSHLRI